MNQQQDKNNKPVLTAWLTRETYNLGLYDDVKLVTLQTKGKRQFKGTWVDLEEEGYVYLEYTK